MSNLYIAFWCSLIITHMHSMNGSAIYSAIWLGISALSLVAHMLVSMNK